MIGCFPFTRCEIIHLPEKLMNFMKGFVEGSIMIAMIYAIQGNP
jgi:hypothetical protein